MLIASLANVSGAGFHRGAVDVDFDATVIAQVVLFVVLLLVLKPLLFDPMLKLFEEREKRIDGAKLEARKMDLDSVGAQTKYDEAMQKARAAAGVEREKLRQEGVKAEAEILGKVRDTTTARVEEGRKNVAAQVATARDALKRDAESMARDVATRILGREVQG
ncbi:MAG: H(+)-transporting ATPase [Polyangiaceae bacterium]